MDTQSSHCAYDPWPSIIKTGGGGGGSGSLPPGSVPPGSDAKFELDNPGAHVGDLMETIGQGCWLCNIFALSYDISVVLTERVFDKIGSGMASLIAVALGIWVLFQAAKLLTPFGPMSGPTGIANIIFIRLGIALLVMTMLRLGFSAYNDMIQAPIMGAGVALSQELLNTASDTLGSLGSVWKKPDCADSFIPTPYISAAATYYNNHPDANTTRRNFICLPRQMQDTLGSGMAFGISNIMAAGNLGEISGEAVVRSFDRFFSGVVLVAVYFIAIIIFGMFLLDMLFRFIMTGVMSPIWLAAAVFPSTRFAFSQGVRQLARCALTLVFMTVLIVIAAGLIGISTQKALTDGQATLKPDKKTAVNACLAKGAAAAAYCKSKGTADKDCDMSYGSGNAPTTGGASPSSLMAPATSGIGGVPASSLPAPGGGTVPKPTPVPIPSSPGSLAAPASFNMPDVYDDSLQSAVYNTPTLSPMMTIIPAVFTTTDSAVPASLFTTVAASGTATPTATPTPTPAPAPVGQCPSVNIGSGGGVGAGMGGSVSQPPANTQPWGGSTDPEAIMFSCMMNVGGFTIGLGNPAFYQMLAGVLVVLLYMSRVYNLAAMYVGVKQSSGTTLSQLMAGITMKGIGIAGGAVAGFAGAGASMAIAGGGKLLGNAFSPKSAPRDGSGGQLPDAGGGGGQPSGGSSPSSDGMSRQSPQADGGATGNSNVTINGSDYGARGFASSMTIPGSVSSGSMAESATSGGSVGSTGASTSTGAGIYIDSRGGTISNNQVISGNADPSFVGNAQLPNESGTGGFDVDVSGANFEFNSGGSDINNTVEVEIDSRGSHLDSVAIGIGESSNVGDVPPKQNWASRAEEAMGGGLNNTDNFFQSAQSFLNNLGKAPQKLAMAVLAPVILATSQGLDRLPPEKREALANATGKAAQIGRVVGNIASPVVGVASKLAGGALAGAKIGFKLNEDLVGGEISLGLTQSAKEKEADTLRRSLNNPKNPNDSQT